MTSQAPNPFSTWKGRKTVPVPQVTFNMLEAYRASLQAEMPPGVSVALHSALHHALSLATNMRAMPAGDPHANSR